ncbi:MAG TPA: AsmA family protein [Candidatus Sulfotelmatobacter sp.]|nr:AsmA family protein [Candidatus Sulfotelmatobacter sp.]
MKIFSSKPRAVLAGTLIVLALFLLHPGATRLKSRVITSISASVGRPVDLSSVHIRLLPRPGFEVENLVVYDDPVFGAEPMIRASEVTADLRLTALLRGRIEIARLDLTEPSLNLVHREGGYWNLGALIQRATHSSLAPTGNATAHPRPHFPYIAGSSGRINFKNGPEKKPYAFINADFALWQDSEDSWGGRMKAQPFRSDLNLTDVGQLQVEGTWKRAQMVRETPLEVKLEWSRAQVGQVTKFLTGIDKGWRGAIDITASLSGSLSKLKISSTAAVDDFRRYDITSGKSLRLAARCDGEYSAETHEFHQVLCSAPVGDGVLTLTGDVGLPATNNYVLSLKAEDVPAIGMVLLAERLKKGLPDDLTAEGTLHGVLSLQQSGSESVARWDGQGEIANFRLTSEQTKAELGPVNVPFVILDDSPEGRKRAKVLTKIRTGAIFPKGAHFEFGPIALGSAHATGASARGWLNRSSYNVVMTGDAEVARTLRLARMMGFPAIAATAEGPAQLNLQIAGNWTGAESSQGLAFAAPQITGTAKLHNIRVTPWGMGDPIEISAEMQLAPDGVHVRKLNAKAASTTWSGSLDMPRGCGHPESCTVHFALNADQLALNRMRDWVSGRSKSRPWYRVLETGRSPGTSLLARLHGTGQIHTSRFVVHEVTATNASANLDLEAGVLTISSLKADVFGGKYRGNWEADFGASPALCSGSGNLSGVLLAKIADQMKDGWIAGTASGSYELKGPCSGDFWQSGSGTLQVEMRDGVLPHVLIGDDPAALRVTRLSGTGQLASGKIEFSSAKLNSPSGTYQISGSVSLNRAVNLKMTRIPIDGTHSGYDITGTLARPQVTPLSNTEQARLKTPAK